MNRSIDDLGPIYFFRAEEFNQVLCKLSKRSIRVLFGFVARVVGNRVTTTQAQIGEALGIPRTSVSKALTELREHKLVFRAKRGVYTVYPGYFCRVVSVAYQPDV